MNKHRIAVLVLTGLLLLPSTVYAKGNSNASSKNESQTLTQKLSNTEKKSDAQNTKVLKKQENEKKKEDKKQQIEEFKTQMKQKHETIKLIKQQTIELKNQIQAKKAKLEAALSDINTGKSTLSEDMINQLLIELDSIKSDSREVKNTAGIKQNTEDVQDKVNKKDFNNALSSMDKVIEKLNARLNALKKLNSDIDKALEIINPSVAPTTAEDTVSPNEATTEIVTEN